MLERYDPERSWHILILHRRVERSSLVGRSGSIHEGEELGSVGKNTSVRSFNQQYKDREAPADAFNLRSRNTTTRSYCLISSLSPQDELFDFAIVVCEVIW
jgi:hypothetical protein